MPSSSSSSESDWPSLAPTTLSPTTMTPTTIAPSSGGNHTDNNSRTPAPSTSNSNSTPTVAPTIHPTTHHHHHSKKQELEIDSSVVVGFVMCVLLALMYRKRGKLPDYVLKLKYYLCCCRISLEDLVGRQQEEHATLNDFIFEVDGNEQTGRVNMSGLTLDQDDIDMDTDAEEAASSMPAEISIQSFFPDLLGGGSGGGQNNGAPNNSNDNNLEEPLIRSTVRRNNNNSNY